MNVQAADHTMIAMQLAYRGFSELPLREPCGVAQTADRTMDRKTVAQIS